MIMVQSQKYVCNVKVYLKVCAAMKGIEINAGLKYDKVAMLLSNTLKAPPTGLTGKKC